MRRLGSLLFLVAVLLTSGCEELGNIVNGPKCDAFTSRMAAHAYVLSIPFMGRENELIPFMQSVPGYFETAGQATRCMQSLGGKLVQRGTAMSNQFSGHPAMDKFGGRMPAGLEHLPGQVDQGLNSYGANAVSMGQELIWLSNVLPAAVQGNPIPYNTTGTSTRQQARQLWNYFQMTCQTNPSSCQVMQVVQASLREQSPVMEEQIYAFFVASSN